MSDVIKGFFIKPARAGLIVRDPATRKPLADAGEWKPRSSYWLRRERDKDVVETKAPDHTDVGVKPGRMDTAKNKVTPIKSKTEGDK